VQTRAETGSKIYGAAVGAPTGRAVSAPVRRRFQIQKAGRLARPAILDGWSCRGRVFAENGMGWAMLTV
jgi:hypothetical protein